MPYKMGVALALMCVWFANFSTYKSELLCSGKYYKWCIAIFQIWISYSQNNDAKTAVVNLKATPFSLSMKTIVTLNSTKSLQAERLKATQLPELLGHCEINDI